MSEANLNSLFEPQAVAVVGASGVPGKVGYSVVSNLLDAGYQGRILPVNPRGAKFWGLRPSNPSPNCPDLLIWQ